MANELRVLYVLEACLGGAGRHSGELAIAMAELGHRVDFVYSPVRMDSLFDEFLSRAKLSGIRLHPLAMRREVGLWDFAHVVAVRRIIDQFGPFDLVHGQSSKGGAIARLAAPVRAARVYAPQAMVTMNPEMNGVKRRVFRTVERALANCCEAIIVGSPSEERHAVDMGLPARKIVQIPVGVDASPTASRAEARGELGLADDVPTVGFVGRLTAQKAPELALAIFRSVLEKQPRARLAIVGKGDLEVELRQVADQRGIESNLIWLGERDARSLIPGFDALLLTSRYESFGMVLVEAATASVPVVSTPVGIAPELLADAPECLFAPSQPQEAAEALLDLLADADRRKRVGRSLHTAAAAYGVAVCVERHLALYRRLTDTKNETA